MMRSALCWMVMTIVTLGAPVAAFAQQSAVIGYVKEDGSIQLYKNRLQQQFADGVPVAKFQITETDGFARLLRLAANGCRGESAMLRIGDFGIGDGPRTVTILTGYPIQVFACQDRSCESQFAEAGWYTAKCEDIGDLKCVCVQRNLSGDNVIIRTGNYCGRDFRITPTWHLSDWVLTQFIQ